MTERCPKKRRNKAGGEREAEGEAQIKELKCCWEGGWGSVCGNMQILKNMQGMEMGTWLARQELITCV